MTSVKQQQEDLESIKRNDKLFCIFAVHIKLKKLFILKDLMTKALTKIAVSIDEYFSWKILKIWPHQAQLNPSKFKMSFI